MFTLPCVLSRAEDELLYSWLVRSAKASGYPSVSDFTNLVVKDAFSTQACHSYQLNLQITSEYEYLYYIIESKLGLKEFFLRTSTFPFYKIFLTDDQQASFIDRCFSNNFHDHHYVTKSLDLVQTPAICPKCVMEDVEKHGHPILRRSHHLPRVVCCHKHHESLKADIYTDPTDLNYEYACYCNQLLEADLPLNADTLKALIRNRINDFYPDKDSFAKDFESSSEGGLIANFNKVYDEIYTEAYMNPELIVPVLMFLFPVIKDFENLVPTVAVPKAFTKKLKKEKCILRGQYAPSLVELMHECGSTFLIHPKAFMEQWSCPSCTKYGKRFSLPYSEPVRNRNTDVFRQEINDLTGGEYQLVGEYHSSNSAVDIKHLKCRHIHAYKPAAFLDGKRCPYCTGDLKREQMEQTVRNLSDNRYEITAKRTHNLYTIRDTITGTRRDMTGPKILQELKRPTPSALLPYTPAKKEDLPTLVESHSEKVADTYIARVRKWIDDNCKSGNPILLDEIQLEGVSYANVKNAMQKLATKKKLLKREAPGVYSLYHDVLTANDIFLYRYLYRNGQHIGYPTGSTALRYLAITTGPIREYRLATNIEASSNKGGRTTWLLGYKLRIKHPIVPVTNENWKILMLLDTACNIKKYLDGSDPSGAFEIMADYVNNNHINKEDFDPYKNHYAFSDSAIERLFREHE